MSSSASSSSASPEPEQIKVKSKKSTTSKGKGKSTDAHGKNEGVDPHWAYEPPAGIVAVKEYDAPEGFDWDALNEEDDCELWLIRVPDSVKPKYLENTKIQLSSSSKTERVATLNRKHANFDVWSIGEGDDEEVGGEELQGLSCLLPRKSKKGKLYLAPKPITRRLVVSAQPVVPNRSSPQAPVVHQNPPRHSYPKELLKHRFLPYGATVAHSVKEAVAAPAEVEDDEGMAVDPPPAGVVAEEKETLVAEKKPKGRKRKETDDPETSSAKKPKPKKLKTAKA